MQDCHKSQKIAICMVGLPARGKTHISRKLLRYLTWLGYNCKVFNIGNYRREFCGTTECDKNFFDPKNEQASKSRTECAQRALSDLIDYLSKEGDVAIFDGTNTTKPRRAMVESTLKSKFQDIQTLWIESICDDQEIIQNNIKLTKLSNPDYVTMNSDEAAKDFLGRIKMYEEVYQEISTDENLSFIKLINIGDDIQIHRVKGYLLSKIISYLMNLHIFPRPIYLTRHGGSIFNEDHKVGGDCDLSQSGIKYAEQLGKFLLDEFPSQEQRSQIHCLTSTMKRAVHTSEITCDILKIKFLQLKTLDEINAGICDGLTYTQISIQFPEDFQQRNINKLTYRYPRGESYLDLISRIEPILYEIERSKEPVVVIAHQAVLRCLYAYFHRNEISEVPQLEIPLHVVIKLIPAAYSCEELRIKIDPETGERKKIEEDLQFARISMLTKRKSFILL